MNLPTLWQNERSSPFRAMNRLQRQFDRLFDDVIGSGWSAETPGLAAAFFQPACDVDETDTHFLMSFDLPGMKKEDIKIEYEGNVLRISGARKDERGEGKSQRKKTERYYGAIERVFTLPQNVKADQIEAHFENGVLHVAVQKAEAAKPKQIPIAETKSGIFSKLLGKREEKVA